MDAYIWLTLIPLVWTNIWHALLLCQPTPDHKPHTMSEHAVMKPDLLWIHRISHTFLSIIMSVFAIGWLIPSSYYFAAALLLSAAINDVIEVYSLNKKTAATDGTMNLHEKTAWLMALSYLLYMVVISYIAGLSPIIYGSVLLFCILLFMRVRRGKNKHFWIIQMIFFTLISLLGLVAHLNLLT